ncbi:hypothetical protein BTO04_08615 [Polaribacter sp. SA4-10]|uniref:Ig-like domain-containing protein n=1 Tax=Polaribacter sp. SA4-10 TaxID=754397 RepID=UPI000B3C27D8|nr:T9SS type B sorting domain-containing protein [Polaribacter sp. SA4-10]ARV06747.1 hypothetical protein BTO04_08615 [Polaribacter sp. SA4-10]
MERNNKLFLVFLLFLCFQTNAQTDAPPVLTATDRQAYCLGSEIKIAPSFTITDPDDLGITSFSIQISSGYQLSLDKLSLDLALHPTINTSWSSSEGKLTLSGSGGSDISYTNLQKAVRDVVFVSTATTISDEKFFSLTIGDVNYLPLTEHFYEYISSIGITWTAAKTAAEGKTYYGRQGYLATLISQEEAEFAGERVGGAGWIGGSDASTPDVWKWVTGPEEGTTFWNGGVNGSSPNFAFWNSGEPNNFGNRGENYVHITAPGVGVTGSWNDLTNTGDASGSYQPKGYVVEYGAPGDPALSIVATTSIYIPKILSTTSASICAGETASLNATSDFGEVFWYVSRSATTPEFEGNNFTTPILNVDTTYYVSGIEGICASISRTPVAVAVIASVITRLAPNSPVCEGEEALFNIKGTASATVTYTINGGTNNATIVLDGAGEGIVTVVNAIVDTTINLNSITTGDCSSSLTNTATVTVNPNPVITILKADSSICSGEDAVFIINGTANATITYTIDNDTTNPTLILDASGEGTVMVAATNDTTIRLIDITLGACKATLTNTVTVSLNENPAIPTISSNSPVCYGTDAIFLITGEANATVTYTVNGAATNETLVLDNAGDGVIAVVDAIVNTTVTLNNIDNSICETDLTNTNTVIVTPIPTISNITNSGPICAIVGVGQLGAIASSGNVQWFATGLATDTTVLFEGETFTVSDLTIDTTYYVAAIDDTCVSSERIPVTITLDTTTPKFDLAQDTYVLCKSIGSVTLATINPQSNDYIYEWYREGEVLLENSGAISVTSPGIYSVKSISLTGCQSIEKSIIVTESEEPTITKDDIIIVDDSDNNSIEVLTLNLGIGDYEFSLDDEFGIYDNNAFIQNIATGMHTLFIKDKNGCGTTSYTFSILAFPKYFTPNGDGENDVWKIDGFNSDSLTIAEISIYNRFGVLLYQMESSSQGWDGRYQGKIVPSNTYWFRVILNDVNGQKIEKTGSISLIRK